MTEGEITRVIHKCGDGSLVGKSNTTAAFFGWYSTVHVEQLTKVVVPLVVMPWL